MTEESASGVGNPPDDIFFDEPELSDVTKVTGAPMFEDGEEPTRIFVDLSQVAVGEEIKIITGEGLIYSFIKPPKAKRGLFRVIESSDTESVPLGARVMTIPNYDIVYEGQPFNFLVEVTKDPNEIDNPDEKVFEERPISLVKEIRRGKIC